MSKKEQYVVIVKDIYVEESVHNWITSCLKARLQDEEKRFNRRIEATIVIIYKSAFALFAILFLTSKKFYHLF